MTSGTFSRYEEALGRMNRGPFICGPTHSGEKSTHEEITVGSGE